MYSSKTVFGCLTKSSNQMKLIATFNEDKIIDFSDTMIFHLIHVRLMQVRQPYKFATLLLTLPNQPYQNFFSKYWRKLELGHKIAKLGPKNGIFGN